MRHGPDVPGPLTQMAGNIAIGIHYACSAYPDLRADMREKQRPGFGDGATKRAASGRAIYVFRRALAKRIIQPRTRSLAWHLSSARFGELNLQGVQARQIGEFLHRPATCRARLTQPFTASLNQISHIFGYLLMLRSNFGQKRFRV